MNKRGKSWVNKTQTTNTREREEKRLSKLLERAFSNFRSSAFKSIAPYFSGKHDLKEFNERLSTMVAQLPEAYRRPDEAVVGLPELLNDLLHRSEDLLVEIEQTPPGKLNVKTFLFLCSRPCLFKKFREEAKTIRKEFEAIKPLVAAPSLRVEGELNLVNQGYQTAAVVREEDIIGRKSDKKRILSLVLHFKSDDVAVIPIVGMGGVGKTTLVQLVFYDEKVQNHFDHRIWASISDLSNLREIIVTILGSIAYNGIIPLGMEALQASLVEAVKERRILIVLDDVWDATPDNIQVLRSLLRGGKQGSKIMITTRYMEVARSTGIKPYEVRVLSENESWELFRRLAFKQGQEKRNRRLTRIGKEIVKKCAKLPLTIKTIASILYSKDTVEEWEYYNSIELNMIGVKNSRSNIRLGLKQSYDYLPSFLKRCFTYCSLLPKDYKFNKIDLIQLWIAQGLVSSTSEISVWDHANEYIDELLVKGFFEPADIDNNGAILSLSMTSTMVDLARHVAHDECLMIEPEPRTQIFHTTVRHMSFVVDSSWKAPSWLPTADKLRSLLLLPEKPHEFVIIQNLDNIFSSLRSLHSLDLSAVNCESLPNSLAELRQLRYLKLGAASGSLPECITRIKNLETLNLRLSFVRELPKDFSKLINLKHLHIGDTLIPVLPRIGRITSLKTLHVLAVGKNNDLEAMSSLCNLDGKLIFHDEHPRKVASRLTAEVLKDQKIQNRDDQLITLSSSYAEAVADKGKDDDMLLEVLLFPPALESLAVWCQSGVRLAVRFSQWKVDVISLYDPNIVSLHIVDFSTLHSFPALSLLPHLKTLQLWNLKDLEYIEEMGDYKSRSSSAAAYFPSLEHLELYELREFKGWSRVKKNHRSQHLLFPRLLELRVSGCPNLMSMPLVPRLESLDAHEINGKLLLHILSEEGSPAASTVSHGRKLYIAMVQGLDCLSVDQFSLVSLSIKKCQELTSLIAESPSSLRQLEIRSCGKLRDISSALQHLSLLEELVIEQCEGLVWGDHDDYGDLLFDYSQELDNDSDDDVGITIAAWQGLKSLRSLTLRDMAKLESLPRGLGCLTMLQELYISWLYNLRALPESIGQLKQLRRLDIRYSHKLSSLPESLKNLTDLRHLRITDCPKLERRCQKPDGKHWPLVQHIPDVVLGQPK